MNKICKTLLISICALSYAYIAEYKPIPQKALLKGYLESAGSTSIQLPFDATLTPLKSFNAEVTKGEPLFMIDPQTAHPMLLNLIHSYFQASENMGIKFSLTQLQKELLDLGVISKNQYHKTLSEFENLQADLLTKRASISQVLAYYQKSIEEIDSLPSHDIISIQSYVQEHIPDYITSPASGVFISRQDKMSGKNSLTYPKNKPVASVLSRSNYELSLLVSASQASQLSKDQEVSVNIQDTNTSIKGTISSIGAYPATAQSRREYEVIISLNTIDADTSSHIRVGMPAAVSLDLDTRNALMVPISYVKQNMGMSHHVMVKNNGISMLREVSLGVSHENEVEVISGLEEGEEIIEHH